MTTTPEQRAQQAAEEIAAAGKRVTARAIRTAAGVSMTVAAAAARTWNEQEEAQDAPPVPETVQLRLTGVWREAVAAARAEHEAARQGWETQLAAAQAEGRELESALEDIESRAEQLRLKVEDLQAQLQGQRTRADRAEARAEAEQNQAQQLRAEAEKLHTQLQEQRTRADRAEALLETFRSAKAGQEIIANLTI
ncbi:MAG: DNA-binding protein [Propionibacteriaceae bacterium]|nr:DNA-binding protein [Propionibacteriaceae bacterium]